MNTNGWKTWVISALMLITSGLTVLVINDVNGAQEKTNVKVEEHSRLHAERAKELAVLNNKMDNVQDELKEIKRILLERLPDRR